jgi:hypothetical protein
MGPFSAGVSADLDILLALKLVHPGWPIQLSKQGENLLKTCNDLLVLNKQSVGYIDRVIRKYGHLDSESIKKKVYDFTIALPKTHEIMKIRDIPKGTPILFKTSTKNAKVKFEMDDSWLTTLEIAFNQEIIDSIAEAYDDAREGRVDEFRSIRTS